MGFNTVSGIDYTLPGSPPLVQPPLSLVDSSINLIDTQGLTEQLRVANEKAASAAEQLADLQGGDEERDQGGQADSEEDAARAIAQMESEMKALQSLASDLGLRLAELSRWENGFVYLPELSNAAGLGRASNNSGATKKIGSNQAPAGSPFYWYDPFNVIGRDDRSLFGWPNTDYESRAQRAQRALVGHEAWQIEEEFWSGVDVPTNYHLTASPNTPTTSPHRTIDAWPNPTPAPGTTLGTAVGLAQSLAALDQAIAESDAGTGMIHATPYVMQEWMKSYPFIRDPGDPGVYTVNHNLMIPGYGYGGVGPDQANRSETDGSGTNASTAFTSASAAFTVNDIGRPIVETSAFGVIPAGTYIASITSPTAVVLSQPATATHGSVLFTVSGQGGRAGGAGVQWAYATEQTYKCRGDINTYPFDLREGSPLVPVNNSIDVRAERNWAILTNRLLRAAVLVDTTMP